MVLKKLSPVDHPARKTAIASHTDTETSAGVSGALQQTVAGDDLTAKEMLDCQELQMVP